MWRAQQLLLNGCETLSADIAGSSASSSYIFYRVEPNAPFPCYVFTRASDGALDNILLVSSVEILSQYIFRYLMEKLDELGDDFRNYQVPGMWDVSMLPQIFLKLSVHSKNTLPKLFYKISSQKMPLVSLVPLEPHSISSLEFWIYLTMLPQIGQDLGQFLSSI